MSRRLALIAACTLALASRASVAQDDAYAPEPSVAAAPPDPANASEADVERALAPYRAEPSVDEVVDAAIRRAGLGRGSIARLARRARSRNAVPVMRIGARRGQGRDVTESQGTTGDRTNLATDDDLTLEANLTFDLRGLVFAPEEVALARERRSNEQARRELVSAIVSRYYERRRLLVEQTLLGRRSLESILRIGALEAELDALTGGEFSASLRESRAPRASEERMQP